MDAAGLAENSMRGFTVGEEKILLFRLSDGFYATQARCTHLFMPLEKGTLVDGERVRCKFHRAEFDVRTGKVCKWATFPPGVQLLNVLRSEKDLKTYRIDVKDGKVYVEV
jgi:3-phenylpropionate/trans-cinnamate dioxygenase ferredoxin subunit